MKREDLILYAITDRSWLNGETLSAQVEKALKGGATFVQLREKHLDRESLLREAKEIAALCKAYGVPFVVNDDVEIALECGADGVHVGQEDMAVPEARRLLGPDKIIGATCKTVEQAILAQRQGADYLGSGAMFPSTAKPNAQPISFDTLREICSAVRIPVVAIGGITQENVRQLRGCGIAGTAVVSAIFAQPDVEAAARKLYQTVTQIL
ncbi:MAG: thiamine phosphate synthase [Oscillospiraceae bacterium]|nr:thiamine phosphate synthase [Oscillospiraceae bacterium]